MRCRPRSPVEPMHIPGPLRTASRPSRTVMELPEYESSVLGRATTWGPSLAQPAHLAPGDGGRARRRRTALSRLLADSAVHSTRAYDRNAAVHALRWHLRPKLPPSHHLSCPQGRHAALGAVGGVGRRRPPAGRAHRARLPRFPPPRAGAPAGAPPGGRPAPPGGGRRPGGPRRTATWPPGADTRAHDDRRDPADLPGDRRDRLHRG